MSADPNPFRAVIGSGEIVDSGTIDGPGAETPHAPGGDDVAFHPGPAGSRPEAEGAPVHLVGAGPGELDLLTLDAVQALGVAREMVADRSLGPLLEALVDEGAIGPLVGTTSPAGFSVTRDHPDLGPGPSAITGPVVWWVDDDRSAIVALLAAVSRGPGVVRLYRGDPWFHPAGDAERAALRTAGVGVGVEILPGVTEELALTAAAGVPVQVRTAAVTTTFSVDLLTGSVGNSRRPATVSPHRSTGTGFCGELVSSGDVFSPQNGQDAHGPAADEPDVDEPDAAFAHADVVVPADAAHTLVVRTPDLAATAARLAEAAHRDGIDPSRPAAALPTGLHRGLALGVRATLADLASCAPAGGGVVVVGLVAALDTRSAAPTAAPRVGSTESVVEGSSVRSGPGPTTPDVLFLRENWFPTDQNSRQNHWRPVPEGELVPHEPELPPEPMEVDRSDGQTSPVGGVT